MKLIEFIGCVMQVVFSFIGLYICTALTLPGPVFNLDAATVGFIGMCLFGYMLGWTLGKAAVATKKLNGE